MKCLKNIFLCAVLISISHTSYAQEPIKIIFLDFDGVLNAYSKTSPYCIYKLSRLHEIAIAPALVQKLNQLVEAEKVKIVVSASIRKIKTLEELSTALKTAGFKGEVIGKTGNAKGRGNEVKDWLLENQTKYNVQKYAVLEDEPSDFEDLSHVVKIDGKVGLTDEDIETAARLLK